MFWVLLLIGLGLGVKDWLEEQQLLKQWEILSDREGLDVRVFDHLTAKEQLRAWQIYADVCEKNKRVYKKLRKQLAKSNINLDKLRSITKEQLDAEQDIL